MDLKTQSACVERMNPQYWQQVCARFGWASCPQYFEATDDLVKHEPEAACRKKSLQSLAVGIPHPQHGIMRVTLCLTAATSLTRLTKVAHTIAPCEFAVEELPQLYVGDKEYRDIVAGENSVVLGVLMFRDAQNDVQCAPLAVVQWRGVWLPYFEDANDWVHTGWDRRGHVIEIFKPFGWGCPVLRADNAEGGGSCSSRASRV